MKILYKNCNIFYPRRVWTSTFLLRTTLCPRGTTWERWNSHVVMMRSLESLSLLRRMKIKLLRYGSSKMTPSTNHSYILMSNSEPKIAVIQKLHRAKFLPVSGSKFLKKTWERLITRHNLLASWVELLFIIIVWVSTSAVTTTWNQFINIFKKPSVQSAILRQMKTTSTHSNKRKSEDWKIIYRQNLTAS